jgi:hypothetical protein
MRDKPKLTWVFSVNSGCGLKDREEHVSAPIDADFYELQLELYRAGYDRAEIVRKEWEKWAWPGGYPIYYQCADGGLLCSHCACKEIKLTSDVDAARDWKIVGSDINYEDPDLRCDHCDETIESAYCEPVVSDGGGESDDAYALASAGHGTDEDYGSAEDVL